jgi:peptidoglycan/LPS O-acetylase OafA/YrhL
MSSGPGLIPKTQHDRRLHELDALRGLAAASVVIGHFVGAIHDPPPWWFDNFVPRGHSAFILFFVLSGYVLSIPFWRGTQLPYSKYILRRFFRLYVPYAAAVSIALVGATRLNGARLPLSTFFYNTWHTPVTSQMVFAQFFRMSTSPAISTALWTLRYEVEISIVFPLICFLIFRLRSWGTMALVFICALVGQAISHWHRVPDFTNELGSTLLWSSCFILGALISWKAEKIAQTFQTIPSYGKLAIALVTIIAYQQKTALIVIPSAVFVILLVENSRLKQWLRVSALQYLGRISFSLYLIHGTVLFTLLILLYGKIPRGVLFVLYLGCSLVAAHLFCIYLEEPATRLGRKLAKADWRTQSPIGIAFHDDNLEPTASFPPSRY